MVLDSYSIFLYLGVCASIVSHCSNSYSSIFISDRVLSDGGEVDAKRGRGYGFFPVQFSRCLVEMEENLKDEK